MSDSGGPPPRRSLPPASPGASGTVVRSPRGRSSPSLLLEAVASSIGGPDRPRLGVCQWRHRGGNQLLLESARPGDPAAPRPGLLARLMPFSRVLKTIGGKVGGEGGD